MINILNLILNKNKIFYKVWEKFKGKIHKINFKQKSKKAIKKIKVSCLADLLIQKWVNHNYPQQNTFYKKAKDNFY
jgi:hypothetical protein